MMSDNGEQVMRNDNQGFETTEKSEFLRSYDSSIFEKPNISIDTVIFTIQDNDLYVLTIKRGEHPYRDVWSLVGGFIDLQKDTDLKSTAKRKLGEKTGVKTPYLEQFCTIGNATRDPRGWSVTVVYFALIPCNAVKLCPGKSAREVKWSKIVGKKVKDKLAFDHAEILANCIERLRNKVLYTSLPVHLMPKDFSLGDLQKVYEIILGKNVDHKSFRRRILSADILEKTGDLRHEGRRPAHLYRLKESLHTHYFMRNIEGANWDS